MSVSKFMCGFFKRKCLELHKFLPLTIPTGFCSQKLQGLIFLALETQIGGPGVGLELPTPAISLPNFYPRHVDVGPASSTSLALLPVWMDVVSLIL